jgi:hypothetical protein
MGYLAATELNPNLPSRFHVTASGPGPNLTEALVMINGISAELNAAAAQAGYTVPIPTTSPGAYSLLQQYTAYGAGWRVLSVQMPNQGGPKDHEVLSSTYRDAYMSALQGLREGVIVLSDAPQDSSGTSGGRILPRSYSTSNAGATVGVVPQVSISQVF